MQRKCAVIAGTLKKILLAKVRDAPCFGIQFDETTNLTRQAQMIAYARFSDKERMKAGTALPT